MRKVAAFLGVFVVSAVGLTVILHSIAGFFLGETRSCRTGCGKRRVARRRSERSSGRARPRGRATRASRSPRKPQPCALSRLLSTHASLKVGALHYPAATGVLVYRCIDAEPHAAVASGVLTVGAESVRDVGHCRALSTASRSGTSSSAIRQDGTSWVCLAASRAPVSLSARTS
jgi:hypothetical protein